MAASGLLRNVPVTFLPESPRRKIQLVGSSRLQKDHRSVALIRSSSPDVIGRLRGVIFITFIAFR